MVPWCRLCASTAEGTGLVPGWGNKIPHGRQCSQNNKNKIKIQIPSSTAGFKKEREELKKEFLFYSSVVSIVEKAVATHSGTLAWKIPWMEEPGRL